MRFGKTDFAIGFILFLEQFPGRERNRAHVETFRRQVRRRVIDQADFRAGGHQDQVGFAYRQSQKVHKRPSPTRRRHPPTMRSRVGRAWRVRISAIGPSRRLTASFQAATVSLASAGRITVRLGIARSAARCSIGWWVGPSSPRPMLSWVKT